MSDKSKNKSAKIITHILSVIIGLVMMFITVSSSSTGLMSGASGQIAWENAGYMFAAFLFPFAIAEVAIGAIMKRVYGVESGDGKNRNNSDKVASKERFVAEKRDDNGYYDDGL